MKKFIVLNIFYSTSLLAKGLSSSSIVSDLTERFLTTAVIIGESFILLMILYYWKKTREDNKKDLKKNSKRNIKQNIKSIRNEKAIIWFDKKAELNRKKLFSKISFKNMNGKIITKQAKKLSLSKGELFLAARINRLSN